LLSRGLKSFPAIGLRQLSPAGRYFSGDDSFPAARSWGTAVSSQVMASFEASQSLPAKKFARQ